MASQVTAHHGYSTTGEKPPIPGAKWILSTCVRMCEGLLFGGEGNQNQTRGPLWTFGSTLATSWLLIVFKQIAEPTNIRTWPRRALGAAYAGVKARLQTAVVRGGPAGFPFKREGASNKNAHRLSFSSSTQTPDGHATRLYRVTHQKGKGPHKPQRLLAVCVNENPFQCGCGERPQAKLEESGEVAGLKPAVQFLVV